MIEALFGNASVSVFSSRNFSVPTLADPVSRGTIIVLGKGEYFAEVGTCYVVCGRGFHHLNVRRGCCT